MKKRIAVGGIVHETNTFVPSLTDLSAFTADVGDGIVERWQGTYSSLGGVLQGLADAGNQPVPLLYASAMPSGMVAQAAYQTLLDEFIERLRAASPLDGVLLVLHGAMVAENNDDCEGDILRRVRAEVGCPLVSVLDMHGSLTAEMVKTADALVAFNQNPHLDTYVFRQDACVLNISIMGGFAYSDVADAGVSVLVTTDNDEEVK